jgi:hypothetical protein
MLELLVEERGTQQNVLVLCSCSTKEEVEV